MEKLPSCTRMDCETWRFFLTNYRSSVLCRPMVDLGTTVSAHTLNFWSDASASEKLGFGAVFEDSWLYSRWEDGYIRKFNPSIEYLELYAVIAAIYIWQDRLRNIRMTLFCDNQAVVGMVNNMVSSYRHCMKLIRLLTMNNLINNRRVFARYIRSSQNDLSDALSRIQLSRFRSIAPESMDIYPTEINGEVYPPSKLWDIMG